MRNRFIINGLASADGGIALRLLALGDFHLADQSSNSSQEGDCFPGLMGVSPAPVIAVPLAFWTASACAVHAADLPTLNCGCTAWLSRPPRGGVAPWRLLHEVD